MVYLHQKGTRFPIMVLFLPSEDYQKKIAEAKRKDGEKKEKTEVRNVKKKIIPCIKRKTKMELKKG